MHKILYIQNIVFDSEQSRSPGRLPCCGARLVSSGSNVISMISSLITVSAYIIYC